MFFFFQAEDGIRDVAVTGVQTCALPISRLPRAPAVGLRRADGHDLDRGRSKRDDRPASPVSLTECWQAPSRSLPSSRSARSEEHTSELQSRLHLVCRLLLEKKKKTTTRY